MSGRPYDAIRSMVERLGGTMEYERTGYRYGAWIIRLDGKQRVLEASGIQSFPDLDSFYIPKRANPRDWSDYSKDLVPDAQARLVTLLASLR